MTVRTGELLTTGEAAVLLGSSRQHVVDLCKRGLLPYVKAGTHRRLRRADVEAVLRPELTRDQLKALWLHRAVAGRLVTDPDGVLSKVRANLDRLRQVHRDGMAAMWLDRWQATLDDGVEAVLDALTSRVPHAVELRQNSPFAGVLPETERRAVLAAFVARWREEHAA
ncbi:helix-turn-helix domain-containing protein [Planosporangium flavigriseum]|uniref:Transcriptional regulator n=1 Tax=Planosporangium flavigriseum TaxID=373681 RepID=A0A8J3LM86_9ACTN|nr:helix-turn-helix domain-containing protein [Planosporangium flavigriseum]GIG75758.1 transcriptional regulator [Planosporangium flavigriseum]